MSEREKRCGTCGAWDEVTSESGEHISCTVYYGPGWEADHERWGLCRRKCDDWPQRGADDWCCEWLPREGGA